MNALSLFDGMSCGQIALNRIGIKPNKYYAAEIDKYAIKVTQANYPNTIQLGDVTKWREWDIDWSSIDLVTGGFPCQAWSMAGKQLGDKDERGALFWTTLDIMSEVLKHNPSAKYLLENVKMKKEFEQYITHHTEQALGKVNKHLINSALVSAQNRQRYYWTNIEGVEQPDDKGILLADILEDDGSGCIKSHGEWKEKVDKPQCIDANYHKGVDNHGQRTMVYRPATITGRRINDRGVRDDYNKSVPITQCLQVKHKSKKAPCLTTVEKDCLVSTNEPGRYLDAYNRSDLHYRKLTPIECERLQTVPDNYTAHVSNTQRYKMLGNGWTVDVIAHIFKELKNDN